MRKVGAPLPHLRVFIRRMGRGESQTFQKTRGCHPHGQPGRLRSRPGRLRGAELLTVGSLAGIPVTQLAGVLLLSEEGEPR